MMKKIKLALAAFAVTLGMSAGVLVPVAVHAATPDIANNLTSGSCLNVDGCTNTVDAGSTVNNIIANVINILSLVVGVIAVIMIVIGGLKYITSGGDSGNVTGAKNTILYAVIGLVVVALAQIIVRFVLEKTVTATN